MKRDTRAVKRESKKIENTILKFRNRDNEPLTAEDDKRKAYSRYRRLRSQNEEGSTRVYHEFTNRTRRKREALNLESSATGMDVLGVA